jgi:histidyl-tRNA synthetase
MQIERCKGCSDLTAEEMLRFRAVESAFQETFKGYGYNEVRTPTLEYLHLFTSAGTLTPGMLRRVYSFLDWDGWSGERVVLKPDATIPAARLYVERLAQAGKPARLAYVTNTFIFEETGTKARERWQCGAELIGAGSAVADAELVGMARDSIIRMGLADIEVKLSHAGLMRAVLSNLGLTTGEQEGVFDRILDGDTVAIDALNTDKPQLVEALKLLLNAKGKSAGFLKNIGAMFIAGTDDIKSALADFIATVELLEAAGISCEIDFTSGKGFEYYTGFIFRLFAGEDNVGGGGRYDRLVGMMGGEAAPAAGFALYVDRLADLLSIDRLYVPVAQRVSLEIEQDAMQAGMEVARIVRDAGMVVVSALEGKPAPDCGWEITVRAIAPLCSLLNCGTGERTDYEDIMELLMVVGLG